MSPESQLPTPAQEQIDKLADIIWWIKGFHEGDCLRCPFDTDHLEALRQARLFCMGLER